MVAISIPFVNCKTAHGPCGSLSLLSTPAQLSYDAFILLEEFSMYSEMLVSGTQSLTIHTACAVIDRHTQCVKYLYKLLFLYRDL